MPDEPTKRPRARAVDDYKIEVQFPASLDMPAEQMQAEALRMAWSTRMKLLNLWLAELLGRDVHVQFRDLVTVEIKLVGEPDEGGQRWHLSAPPLELEPEIWVDNELYPPRERAE